MSAALAIAVVASAWALFVAVVVMVVTALNRWTDRCVPSFGAAFFVTMGVAFPFLCVVAFLLLAAVLHVLGVTA